MGFSDQLGDSGDASDGNGGSSGGTGDNSGSGSDESGGSGGGGGGDDGGGVKFDIPTPDVAEGGGCGDQGGDGKLVFSFIWIANTNIGQLSKIDTQTVEEVGRYRTHPPGGKASPSRTSVNLNGDMAVTNRHGSVAMFINDPLDCLANDQNGIAGLQTSTGKDDVLDFGQDDCLKWYQEYNPPGLTVNSQRPAAWTSGELNEETCKYDNAKLWTAVADGNQTDSLHVLLLDDDDGAIEADVWIPEVWVKNNGEQGLYGGAVDSKNDLWAVSYGRDGWGGQLVNVRLQDQSYQVWDAPTAGGIAYGIAVDGSDRIWIATQDGGALRYDPAGDTWDLVNGVRGHGLQVDAEQRVWVATNEWHPNGYGLQAIDADTLQLVDFVSLPVVTARGVSIDFEGFVWFVDMVSSAFKVDPDSHTYDVYDQLDSPYTYSDMTGWGLASVNTG
jgi:hypothetical protein